MILSIEDKRLRNYLLPYLGDRNVPAPSAASEATPAVAPPPAPAPAPGAAPAPAPPRYYRPPRRALAGAAGGFGGRGGVVFSWRSCGLDSRIAKGPR